MDFFEHQEHARRLSRKLVVLFALAVGTIFTLTYLLVAGSVLTIAEQPITWGSILQLELLAIVGLGLAVMIGGGALYRLTTLRGGGHTIARMLGGQLVVPGSADPSHRKVLNVVEEMAIASGVPVPPVYVMEQEKGINAFAAGYSPSDAVVGVTRGCIDLLNRDELQGVMAHEFSHIIHGDMRLNIRLIAMVHGILMISLAGYSLLRAAMYSNVGRSRNNRNNPMPLLALGGALVLLGWMGVLFSRWIKAAISRQREYLADAAAVQFTRNPDGIAGALKKIGGYVHGAQVVESQAEQTSHMFFGQAITSGLSSLFATHPPLAQRIRRIDPGFDGKFPKVQASAVRSPASAPTQAGTPAAAMGLTAHAAPSPVTEPAAPAPVRTASDITRQVGQMDPQHLTRARELMAAIPQPVNQAAHEPFGARAVIFGLLLSSDQQVREQQFKRVQHHSDTGVYQVLLRLWPHMKQLDPAVRIVLIDMALPTLRELSDNQYQMFRQNLIALIEADKRISLFEWALQRIVLHHLDPNFTGKMAPSPRHRRLIPVAEHCAMLLSALTYVGHPEDEEAERAFRQAARQLQLPGLARVPADACDLRKLEDALTELALLTPQLKQQVVQACATCIAADAKITVRELELFRAIADVLDCPVPPMVPSAD